MSQINPLIGDTTTKSISDAVKFTTVGNVEQENHGSSKLFKATRGLYTPAGELPHSIESFLGRPIRVGSFQYSTGSMRGNLAYGCDILTVIKEHPEMKLYRDKLDGFYAMNATAEFKVLVNAQPCEAGQLLLGFIPFSNKYWNDLNIGWGQEIVLPLLSGFNAMDFNIATESEVVYTVPYTGPNPAIQLKYNRGWGTFFITPVTPLLAADNVSSCEVVIYLQLKDIELYGITESSTQGLDEDFSSTITKMASSTINETMERGKTIATNIATDLVEDAIGGIPKISDIAGGVAFVAEATQNISKIFGLSKPVADPSVTRVACSPFGQMQNCDGDSTAYKLGATTSQGIKVTPLGLTDADELSFKEIVRAPNYYQYFTWNNSQAPGTKIGRVPVSPNCALWYNSVMYPSRLRFVANYFQFWRGTIIYHFRLSSNKFHSGRLRFVLELGSDNKSVDNVNNPYHFSEIVDIRDGMCIQVRCPFISTKPWRFVPTASNISTGFTNAGYMTVDPSLSTVLDSEVHLGIYVENSLRAPDNVSHSIELATYVSGGEDIEFAGYRDTNHATVANHGGDIEFANPMDKVKWTEAPDGSKDEEPGWDITEAHTQGMLDVPDIAPINIAGLPEQCKVDLTASEMSVGEVFTSFRPLLKRYMSTGTVQKSDKASKPIFGIYPYRTTYSVKSWYNTELLTNLLPLWRFYRGGVRILMVPDRQQGIAKVGYNTYLINEKDVAWDGPSPVQKSTSMSGFGYSAHVSFALSLQGGVELEFPGYTPYACCLFAKQDSLKNYVNAMAHGEVPMGVASVSFPSQVTNVDTYRSVADDFTAGYLMGAPPVIWNIDNSSKANAIDF